jgi:hypothetical protein
MVEAAPFGVEFFEQLLAVKLKIRAIVVVAPEHMTAACREGTYPHAHIHRSDNFPDKPKSRKT